MTAGGFFKAIGKAVANGVRSSVTRVKNLFGKNKNKYSTRTKSRTMTRKNNAKPANAPPANAPKPPNAPPANAPKPPNAPPANAPKPANAPPMNAPKPANAPPMNAPKPANVATAVGGKKMRASNLGKLMFYKPKRKATRRRR
jgi:uncharacterized membrane protein